MATRKTSTSTSIDSVQVVAIALKRCKSKAEYNRIAAANSEEELHAAWNTLTHEDQERIHSICGATPQPDLQVVADELAACGSKIQLQAVKAEHGADIVKAAWGLIPAEEKMRLTGICQAEQTPEDSNFVKFTHLTQTTQPQPRTRTLFTIGDDLERLNELLDETTGDAAQQELVAQWFEQLGDERDRKLDGYAALIAEMMARAEVRKSEARRLQELGVRVALEPLTGLRLKCLLLSVER